MAKLLLRCGDEFDGGIEIMNGEDLVDLVRRFEAL